MCALRSLCLLLLLPLLAGGCRTPGIPQADEGAVQYQDVQLVYDVNSRYRDLPLGPAGVRQANHDVSPDAQEWRSVRLRVDYPHPEGIPGLARATLRLSSQSDSVYTPVGADVFRQGEDVPADLASDVRPKCDDELWVLDIPRNQLDQLLAELDSAGFFHSQMPNELGTRLDVRINGSRTSKTWSAEPRLDEFVHRVHTDGRLSGFIACGCELPDGRTMAKR